MQRGVCLQLAQTWPNFWQLKHWVRVNWDLYASTLMQIWQRLESLNMSGDFVVLGRVTREVVWNRQVTDERMTSV
jgi:hypothetical protein